MLYAGSTVIQLELDRNIRAYFYRFPADQHRLIRAAHWAVRSTLEAASV
jgi:hypothetical protein